jgi:Protein of unknown function (DUF1566)
MTDIPKQTFNAIVLFAALSFSGLILAQSTTQNRPQLGQTQMRGVWVDPATHLMWASKDNGIDLDWRQAMKYCHTLLLTGYSDWRLASLSELQGIYDKSVEAPGLSGDAKSLEAFTWHVKGGLFLTGDQWSGREVVGRMPLESYEYYFDFNEGRAEKDPSGWPYPFSGRRALCVRGPAIYP